MARLTWSQKYDRSAARRWGASTVAEIRRALFYQCGYGWVIEPDGTPGGGEWAIVVQCTARQDGRTSWAVLLTEVDNNARHMGGLSPTSKAAADIRATPCAN
jgi:hypothetical protein